ncbi:hypothetical protein F4775DRAFT_589454 [Biscogniauxia sp. FL1348]|nr:hypothetical protein F4775DRAFT_589454 [Biscogniauxia sp. FL1348]
MTGGPVSPVGFMDKMIALQYREFFGLPGGLMEASLFKVEAVGIIELVCSSRISMAIILFSASNPSFSTLQHSYKDPIITGNRRQEGIGNMCDWEEFLFVCNHSTLRLKSYCHFARNDPNHQCFGVKMLRNSWFQDGQLCDACLEKGLRLHNGTIWQLSPSMQQQQQQQPHN